MTRFQVAAIAAGLLLALSGPSFAAKRKQQNPDATSSEEPQSRSARSPHRDPYTDTRDPYAYGVNWPKGS